MSATLADQLTQRLRERLNPSAVTVEDESWKHAGHVGANGTGFGTHFRVHIQCSAFAGQPRVARHRMIYEALQDLMDEHAIHALAIDARE